MTAGRRRALGFARAGHLERAQALFVVLIPRRICPKGRLRPDQRSESWSAMNGRGDTIVTSRANPDVNEDGIYISDESEASNFPIRMRRHEIVDWLHCRGK